MVFDVISEMFNNTLFFIFFVILVYSFMGWLSGSFSVGVLSGWLIFVNITVQQGDTFMTNILYISMVAILFFTAFKTYGFAFSGDGTET